MLKIILSFVLIFFLGFIAWMNLTPGHFQENSTCYGKIKYIESSQVEIFEKPLSNGSYLPCEMRAQEPALLVITKGVYELLLKSLSSIDLYK